MDAKFHKGIEQAELGKHEKAIIIFDEILKDHKDNVNVVYAKSRSMAALNEDSIALGLLKEAVSKNPKTIRAWAKEEKIFAKYHTSETFRKMVKM